MEEVPMNYVKFDLVHIEASEAAQAATADFDQDNWFPCGFAWVNISGRGSFAKYAKECLDAHKNYSGAGFNIWYSTVYDNRSQSMDCHVLACEAYAAVLNKHGIKATVHSRMD